MNFGTGIAFHDMNTNSVNNIDSLVKHYVISQGIIRRSLTEGLQKPAEPNGVFWTAAMSAQFR